MSRARALATSAASARPRRSPPTALARAEHHAPPVKLTAKERALLDEGLARGQEFARRTADELVSFGSWLLVHVFGGDTSAALDQKSENPVWMELVARAGGPTLDVSRNLLYMAVKIAAYDKRMPQGAWRRLAPPWKALLLPLDDEAKMREAAQQVADFSLTQAKTKELVTSLMADEGRDRRVRLTASALVARVAKLRTSIDDPRVLRRAKEIGADLEPAERRRVAGEIARLRDALDRVARALNG